MRPRRKPDASEPDEPRDETRRDNRGRTRTRGDVGTCADGASPGRE
jgi:hypothetical protein